MVTDHELFHCICVPVFVKNPDNVDLLNCYIHSVLFTLWFSSLSQFL